jgi:hypothetical protein
MEGRKEYQYVSIIIFSVAEFSVYKPATPLIVKKTATADTRLVQNGRLHCKMSNFSPLTTHGKY